MKRRTKIILAAAGLLVVLAGGALWWADHVVARCGEACYASAAAVPARRVAVVLGTSRVRAGGGPNRYFAYRIAAALELWRAGRVQRFLVSGDNGSTGYNEPREMHDALVAGGVPDAAIQCDYAGFRTLDSMVRAKEVFGLDGFIVVSQRFHNERAIYIARSLGLDVVGYDAADVDDSGRFKTVVREKAARAWCVLDLWVLGTQPHFLGPKIAM